jgi:Fe-S oxidoreductase
VQRGVAIVGLEPSCLLTMRDEFANLLTAEERGALAEHAFLFEEFLVREQRAGRLDLNALQLKPLIEKRALLHGHCHQKAFGVMSDVEAVLKWIPGLTSATIESSCCGMAGAFGYEAEHIDTSMNMAELSLLPAVRGADANTLLVADGTSCRHQIKDGAEREALHVAQLLARAIDAD